MLVLPPDFEARTLDAIRRCTDDIVVCDRAEIEFTWQGGIPFARFAFGDPRLQTRPAFYCQLVTQSISNPLAEGKPIEGDKLRRHVRDSIENYLHLCGLKLETKVPNA